MSEPTGPYVVWTNNGYDGWHPKSYATAQEALFDTHYGPFVLTRLIPPAAVTVVGDAAIDAALGEK